MGFPGLNPNIYFRQSVVPVTAVTILLSTLFMGLRFWSRFGILRTIALEDELIFLD